MGLFTFIKKMTDGVADALNANFKRVHLDTYQGYSDGNGVPDFVAGNSYLPGALTRSAGGSIYSCIAEIDDAVADPANDPAHWSLVVFALAGAPGLSLLTQAFASNGPSFSLAPLPRSVSLVFGDGGLQPPGSYSYAAGVLNVPGWAAFQTIEAIFVPASQTSSHDIVVETFDASAGPTFNLAALPVGGWLLVFGDDALQSRGGWNLNGTQLTLAAYATFETVSIAYVALDQPQYNEFDAATGPVFQLSPKPTGRMLMVFGDGRKQPSSSYMLNGAALTLPSYHTFQTVSVAYL